MSADRILKFGKETTEQKITELLDFPSCKYDAVIDAMKYSSLAGGKRLRPALLLEFYRVCGGTDFDAAANFAAAIEFIHTYSLIHDDLPCMDNDDMRRGRPSCHIQFGEDTALLAGDALLTLAFATTTTKTTIDSSLLLRAANVLADRSGVHGMVGGQVIDLAIENTPAALETILDMYSRKTGALISAAAEIGCILAGASDDLIDAAADFAKKIGLAFQITDDLLDITSTAEELGKPIGSDEKNQKSTAVSILGFEEANKFVEKLTKEAISSLSKFNDTVGLCELANMLTKRKN